MMDVTHQLRRYILKNGEPVPEPDLLVWAHWMAETDLHLADDTEQGIRVSTVFLGLDHDFSFEGKPVLFETMIFGGDYDKEMERYCTREEALTGHAKWCQLALQSPPKKR